MKNKLKTILIILMIAIAMSAVLVFVGCTTKEQRKGTTGGNDSQTVVQPSKLDIPDNICLNIGGVALDSTNKSMLSWGHVDNATSYSIFVDGVETVKNIIVDRSRGRAEYALADVVSAGEHDLQVKAVGDGTNYSDSSLSESKNFVVPTKGLKIYGAADGVMIAGCDDAAKKESTIILPTTYYYDDQFVTEIAPGAFRDCTELVNISIPDSVKSIGCVAFKNCAKLTNIIIPNSVTTIDYRAFLDSGLTDIVIPNSVTSIGQWAFAECDNLENVAIESGSIKFLDFVFSNNPKLKNVTLAEGMTSIEYRMFNNCPKLVNIKIPDSVTKICGGAFGGTGLTEIRIPNSVTTIERNAFVGCELTEVALPSGITVIEDNLFFGCKKLKNVIIPDGVTTIKEGAFYGCSELASLVIPSSVTTFSDSAIPCDNNSAIYSCDKPSIKWYYNYELSKSVSHEVSTLSRFAYHLKEVILPDDLKSIEESAFENFWNLEKIIIPDSVTTIAEKAFSGCRSLTSIVIPENVASIGEKAFEICDGLVALTIPKSVINIGSYAFDNCRNLKSLKLADGVKSIGGYAFNWCEGLKTVIIPKSVEKLGKGVFYQCPFITIYMEALEMPSKFDSDWNAYGVRPEIWGCVLSEDRTYIVSCNGFLKDRTSAYEATSPSRDGYIFKEWNTSKDGSGTTVMLSQYDELSKGTTLFAIWETTSN